MFPMADLDPLDPAATSAIPDGSIVDFDGVSIYDSETIRTLAGRGVTAINLDPVAGQLVRTLLGTSRARKIDEAVMSRPAKRNARYNKREQELIELYERQQREAKAR